MGIPGKSVDRRQLLRIGASGAVVGGLGTSLPRLLDRGSAAPEDDKLAPGHAPLQDESEHGPLEGNSSTAGDIEFGEARLNPIVFATNFDYGYVTTMVNGT